MGTNVFKLDADGNYRIDNIIPSVEEIKSKVPAKILEYFGGDENAESKIHRLGIINPSNPDFIAYNQKVEQLRAEADREIKDNEIYLASLKQVEIGEGLMKKIIYVEDNL